MAYELHIWGPAFGFPSIDAACTASTAYLKKVLLPNQWVLVVDHSPQHALLNGTCAQRRYLNLTDGLIGSFPALHVGSDWIYGFTSIVARLAKDGYTIQAEKPQGEIEIREAAEKHMYDQSSLGLSSD